MGVLQGCVSALSYVQYAWMYSFFQNQKCHPGWWKFRVKSSGFVLWWLLTPVEKITATNLIFAEVLDQISTSGPSNDRPTSLEPLSNISKDHWESQSDVMTLCAYYALLGRLLNVLHRAQSCCCCHTSEEVRHPLHTSESMKRSAIKSITVYNNNSHRDLFLGTTVQMDICDIRTQWLDSGGSKVEGSVTTQNTFQLVLKA